MKILDEKPWQKAVTCNGCGSKLLAEHGDIIIRRVSSGWDEPACDTAMVPCPVCGEENEIGSPHSLPKGVREEAERRRPRGRDDGEK